MVFNRTAAAAVVVVVVVIVVVGMVGIVGMVLIAVVVARVGMVVAQHTHGTYSMGISACRCTSHGGSPYTCRFEFPRNASSLEVR